MTPTRMKQDSSPPRCGQYELLVRIGKGGMASVYLARVRNAAGFSRLYALKVLHPHLSEQPAFVDMLMDEARIAARLHHPHVVSTVDVGNDAGRHFLAMDYVEGVALDRLMAKHPTQRPPSLIVPVAIDALRGLHAAHQLRDETGAPLELVHRDVTPGNVIVGVDGTGRIADFGVAKARARITKTHPGIIKGKAGYIAPEVVLGQAVDGRADVFSMGVLLWNALTGQALFDTDDLASTLTQLVNMDVPPPSTVGLEPPAIFDAPILGALHRDPQHRHESALEMAQALEDALLLHGARLDREAVGAWVRETFGPQLDKRREYAASVDASPKTGSHPPGPRPSGSDGPTEHGAAAEPEEDDDPFAPTVVSETPAERFEQTSFEQTRAEQTSFEQTTRADVERADAPRASVPAPAASRGRAVAVALLMAALALILTGAAAAWWWTRPPAPTMTATPLEEAPAASAAPDSASPAEPAPSAP